MQKPSRLRLLWLAVGFFTAVSSFLHAEEGKPAATPHPAIQAKRLWGTTPAKLMAPFEGDYSAFCLGIGPDGNFLFQVIDVSDAAKGPVFVVFDPKTKTPVRRIAAADKPKGTVEWTSEQKWLPDGRFLHIGVTRGTLEPDENVHGKVLVGVNLRIVDTQTGKISERLFPYDDPSGSGMSEKPCFWSGQVCVIAKMWGKRLLMDNNYFLAEFDPESLKTIRSLTPEIEGFWTPDDDLIQNGRVLYLQHAGGNKEFLIEFDKPVRELSKDEAKEIRKSRQIEEIPHPKTVRTVYVKKSRKEGSRLFFEYKEGHEMEFDLGASLVDANAPVYRYGDTFVINVYSSPTTGKEKRKHLGSIAVAAPID